MKHPKQFSTINNAAKTKSPWVWTYCFSLRKTSANAVRPFYTPVTNIFVVDFGTSTKLLGIGGVQKWNRNSFKLSDIVSRSLESQKNISIIIHEQYINFKDIPAQKYITYLTYIIVVFFFYCVLLMGMTYSWQWGQYLFNFIWISL